MTRTRILALAGAVVLSALGSSAATAASKPKPKPKLCNLVQDKPGDVVSGDQALDVVSADVATNAKTVTAVVRFAKLAEQDLLSPTGRFVEFTFAYEGRGQSLTAYISPLGEPTWGAGSTGKVDLAKNEIRIHLPADSLVGRPVLKSGAVFTNLLVRSDLGNPAFPFPMTLLVAGDSASGTKPYPIHAASCVTVGV